MSAENLPYLIESLLGVSLSGGILHVLTFIAPTVTVALIAMATRGQSEEIDFTFRYLAWLR